MSVKTKIERLLFKTLRLPTCEEVEEFAYDFLEEKLDRKTLRKVERHLKICPPCIKFMDSYRKTKKAGKGVEAPPLDSDLKEELFKFLKKNPQTQ